LADSEKIRPVFLYHCRGVVPVLAPMVCANLL